MREQIAGRTIKIGLIAVMVTVAIFAAVLVVPDITHAFAQEHDVEMNVKMGDQERIDDEATDLQKIKKAIKSYKKALSSATDEEDVNRFQKIIDRLKIAKQIIIHTNSQPFTGGSSDETMFDYTAESARLVGLLEDTYSDSEIISDEPVFGGEASRAIFRHRIIHDQTQFDCEDRRSVTGRSISIITLYSSGGAFLSGTFNYPDDMNKQIVERRRSPCTEFDHNKSWTTWTVLANAIPGAGHVKSGICKLESTVPVGRDTTSCNVFERSRIILIMTGSEYESSSGKTTHLGNLASTVLFS